MMNERRLVWDYSKPDAIERALLEEEQKRDPRLNTALTILDLQESQGHERVAAGQYIRDKLEELLKQSTTDGLTGLRNHRYYKEIMEHQIALTERHGNPLSLLLIDIDKFKQTNDEHGHPAGDRVLQRVAKILEHHARKSDHVCRYGGEEFAIVLPETDLAGAMAAAEHFRDAVEQEMKAEFDGETIPVTISIGAAQLAPLEGEPQIRERADKALYQSKHAGRNRVTASSEATEIASPAIEAAAEAIIERSELLDPLEAALDQGDLNAQKKALAAMDPEKRRALLRALLEMEEGPEAA